jgi:flagellar basal body-associated protein FliL
MPPQQPPRKRGLMITMIVLSVVLVLCLGGGVGAYFLLNRVSGTGQSTPEAAVDGFLKAVLEDKNPAHANDFVCQQSRDTPAITKKIDEYRTAQQKYKDAKFTWAPPTVQSQNDKTATLTTTVKLSTDDDRTAESKLKFVTVKESGWWVCEVAAAT